MAFGLGTIAKAFGMEERSLEGQQNHERTLSYGNAMGLKPEVGDPSAHYQTLLSQFEARYNNLIEPPEGLDPEQVTTLEFQAAEAKQQEALRSLYRSHSKTLLDTEVAEYKAILQAQTGAETKSQEVQDTNIKYLRSNVQRSFKAASNEADFGGGSVHNFV